MTAALCSGNALAQEQAAGSGKVQAKGGVYHDDDATTVATVVVDGQVGLPKRTRVGVHGLVDVVSSASVDVVSEATERFKEVRLEVGGRAGIKVGDMDFGVGFVHSAENDWQSYSPSATFAIELLQKNLRLGAGYGFGFNEVGRSHDPNFAERMTSHAVDVRATQVLDKKSLVTVSYTLQVAQGWLSSPYRYVRAPGQAVLETHPAGRIRHAISTNGRRYLAKGVGLDLSYRFYGDDWGILSHTVSTALLFEFLGHFKARVRARGYYQVAADFWRENYDGLLRYMSADRELSTFWDIGGGAKLGWKYKGFSVNAKADVVYYEFIDFARLSNRTALVSDLGVGYKW